MRCPTCQFENREERAFCAECGASLASPCPACGFLNETGEKFCGGCGVLLTPVSPPLTAKPQAIPAHTPESVHNPKDSLTERRQLTVMFCDLVGSTAISERVDPEELRELLAAYQKTCAAVVSRFDGYLAFRVGDGLLIYFGYPQAHEDDAVRAVRAGLDIIEAIRALNAEVALPEITLAVRIGINTGLVVAGDIGNGECREEMAIVGETPNIAARLQTLAKPGTVVIGPSTHRLVEGMFICNDLGPRHLKGISEPVRVYRVRAKSGARNRFEARVTRGLTPLVGRDEEISILLKRWEQAQDGEGQVVLLSGEAGIGKSRILRGFQEHLGSGRHNQVLYYCSPYQRNSPFYPAIDQLERGLGFRKSDSMEQKLDKLDTVLGDLGLPVMNCALLLASLLSLTVAERYPSLALTPQDAKKKTLEVLFAIITATMSREPLLMIVEDAHWIDPSTLELLALLVERLRSARFLLVVTFRPEFEPPWGNYAHVTGLTLNHLSHRESADIVAKVAGGKALPAEIIEHIVAKTDGVPLFVEELTKTVLESGLLQETDRRFTLAGPLPALAIPTSLQDSLMARLDRLGPVKEVAQLAATLGRTFGYELLAAVAPLEGPALADALSQLVDAELIYQHGELPDATYEFKHALVQDVAYSSLLHSKRRQLHGQIGKVLEERFPATAELQPELLAYHYREAALLERSVRYALRAGDVAAGRYAAVEARARYQAALEMAKSLAPTENTSRLQIQAILKLANVASNREQLEGDLANMEYARTLAEAINHQHRLCQIYYWTGRINYVLGRFDLSAEYAEKSLQIAEALGGDDRTTAGPVNLLARLYCLRGEGRKSSEYAARSLEQMHRLGNCIEEAAVAGVLAFAYGVYGRFPQAFVAADHGLELARKLDHLPTLAACFFFRGVVKGWYGELLSAVSDFEEAIAIAEKAGDVFRQCVAYGWRGEAYLLAENVGPARDDLTRCLALGDQIGTSFHRGAFQAFLAKVHLLQGDIEAALRISEEACEIALATAQAWSHSIALRSHAEVLLRTDPPNVMQAEDDLRAAIAIQEKRECRCDLAWSRLALGHVFVAKGDLENAKQAFTVADQMFQETGIKQGQEKALTALATLVSASGVEYRPITKRKRRLT
jgi:class 3 adenylate cyclase/tetratricopeptide (TPR) repeat protein